MAYTKHTWEPQELITADLLNNIEDGLGELFDSRILNATNYGVSIYNEDNSDKLNDLFIKASNNSKTLNVVYIPSGKYNIKKDLVFTSNIILYMEKDTILYAPDTLFKFPSTGKGYGNGVNNTTIIGGVFSGDYENGGSFSGSLHHAKNIKFKNVTFNQTTDNTHTLDLSGCIDVLVDNCYFYGFNIQLENRDYVEAIQLDYSYTTGLTDTSENELSNVDGLPTKNVTVINSTFAPIYNKDGSIKYTAPNPIGSHIAFSNGNPANIIFDNNTIIDAASYNASVGINGWVHFYGVDNLTITNNKFINNSHQPAIAIGARILTTNPLPYADGSKDQNSVYDIHHNINIDNNYFSGFKSTINTIGTIVIQGNSLRTPDDIVRITNNIIVDSFPDTADKFKPSIANGTDFISVRFIENCIISDNYYNGGRRLLYITSYNTNFDNTYIIKDNIIKNAYYMALNINDLNNKGFVEISNNKLINVNGAFNLYKLDLANISNNNIIYRSDGKISSGNIFYDNTIYSRQVNNLKFSNNISKQSTDYKYTSAIKTENTTISDNDNLNINF